MATVSIPKTQALSSNPNTTVGVNPNIPTIPNPLNDLSSLATVVLQLKKAVESLGGNRGSTLDRAVTFNDMIRLGLASPQALMSPTGASGVTVIRAGVGVGGTPSVIPVNNLGAIGNHLRLDAGINRVTTVILTTDLTDFTVISTSGANTFVNALVAFTQDAVGHHEVTFPSNFRWQGSYSTALQWVPGATDLLNIVSIDGGLTWLAAIAIQAAAP